MVSLLHIRDAIAIQPGISIGQLCCQFAISRALMQAMLDQLENMHKIERIEQVLGCGAKQCHTCSPSNICQSSAFYRLVE